MNRAFQGDIVRIATIGLGEAGRLYAEGFARLGADVSAYDPVAVDDPAGVRRRGSIAEAVADADFVVSLVGAAASRAVLGEALPAMGASAVFADLNTGAPSLKAELAAAASAAGRRFADVAVMAPVPRAGAMTPLLASGDGAESLVAEWSALGIPVSGAGMRAGSAAGLKMLRSVFMKGLAALVFEAAGAAEAAGSREWMLAEMASELGPDGAALVGRLIDGTRLHAQRREHEMLDARDYLHALEAPAWVTSATIQWLHAIAEDPGFPNGGADAAS